MQETVDIFYYGNELYSDANGIIAQAREVTFREEKNGIYEIHNKESGKKMVKVSKWQFTSGSDDNMFTDLFEIKDN